MTGTYTVKDLDDLFGFKAGWTYHHWKAMVREQGFPEPLAAALPRLRWSRPLVDAWFRREAPAPVPETPAVPPPRRGFNLAALDRAR